jgi:uncharacterized protein YueI
MKIALDYDNTFTQDPGMWMAFIYMAQRCGHEITIVTSRHPHTPVPLTGLPVIYCGFTAKHNHHKADVWIDDDPKHIHMDHDMSLLDPSWKKPA